MEHINRKLEKVLTEICASNGIVINAKHYDEHLAETPARMIKAWGEMLSGYNTKVDLKLSKYIAKSHDWVGMTNIEFNSLCMHHWLPFIGRVDIMYVPGISICGASKLARVVDMYSRRLQLQEYMTNDIYQYLMDNLQPSKLGVRIVSQHCCVGCRGITARNANFVTYKVSNGHMDEFMNALKWRQ